MKGQESHSRSLLVMVDVMMVDVSDQRNTVVVHPEAAPVDLGMGTDSDWSPYTLQDKGSVNLGTWDFVSDKRFPGDDMLGIGGTAKRHGGDGAKWVGDSSGSGV